MSDKSDLKAELERKKQRLAQIREEKKRKEEERKKKEVRLGLGCCGLKGSLGPEEQVTWMERIPFENSHDISIKCVSVSTHSEEGHFYWVSAVRHYLSSGLCVTQKFQAHVHSRFE